MENELINYWGKKSFCYVSILWLISQILFAILAAFLINPMSNKLINIFLIIGINSLILIILFGFSISNYTYETVYQIKVKGSTYDTKFYRYLIILFGFGWLIFFILNALFMLLNGIIDNTSIEYFTTLSTEWWKLLLVTSFNLVIIIIHRQLMYYTLTYSVLPWAKSKK